jgi:hypothetical protein
MGENRAAVSVAVFSRFAIYANVVRRTRLTNVGRRAGGNRRESRCTDERSRVYKIDGGRTLAPAQTAGERYAQPLRYALRKSLRFAV